MEEGKRSGKKSWKTWLVALGILAIIAAVVLVLMILTQGSTKTSGGFPEPEETESITCTKGGEVLSLFDTKNATSLGTKVTATFEKGKMKTISVNYSMKYDSEEAKKDSINTNHVKINLATQEEGLGYDIFNLRTTSVGNELDMRMYTEAEKITNVSAKYLMLEQAAGNYSMSSVKSNYVSQEFKCE